MKKLLLALTTLTLAVAPGALAYEVVAPHEPMVLTPGLERLGPSRVSTVVFCANQVGVDDYRDLLTDSEFEGMEICLVEMT